MSLVEKAVDDARQAEMAAITDRMLAESLAALCAVMDCEDAQMTSGPAVAGMLAMLATLCKDLVPSEMPRDFPVVEIFGALARDPEFEPLAQEIVEEMALDEVLAEPPVYQAELVPQLPAPSVSTTEAAFVRLDATTVATGAPLNRSQVVEVARQLRTLAMLTGLPLGMLSPLLFTAIACHDMYEVYQATDSVERAARSLLRDGRNVANIVLAVTQIGASLFVGSNESNLLEYLVRPLRQAGGNVLNSPAWMATHPSATTILNVLQKRRNVIARLPTQVARGIDAATFGDQTDSIAFWNDAFWGNVDAFWNGGNATADMGKLLNWIQTVKDAPMGPLGLNNVYKEVENLGLFAAGASVLINAAQLTPVYRDVLERAMGGSAEDQLENAVKDIDELRNEMGPVLAPYANLDPVAAGDQSQLDNYKANMLLAAESKQIDAERLLPLMKALWRIRRSSKRHGWSVVRARRKAQLEKVVAEVGELVADANYDWDGMIDAPCRVAPSASVVDVLFRGRA